MQANPSFGNILDVDNYTDFVSDAVDAIGDAGHEIGAVLKGIAPALAFVPGIGTALSVAVYAAGAISAHDSITDAVIGTASAAMPPGLPRIGFDGAANITRDIAQGKNAFASAVEACRQAAGTAGPQAQAAFDAALKMGRGGRIDSRLIAEAKASFANGGKTAEMAFDAGIAIANNESADQVILDVSRNYIRDAGGPLAAAAFDSGVALSYGQTLQEAGYAGLHTLVRGNNPIELIEEFVKQVGFSKAAGIAVPVFLQQACVRDAMNAVKGAAPQLPDFDKVKGKLGPLVKAFQDNLPALDIPSGDLAQQWGLDEALVRAAQSMVDRVTGAVDNAFLQLFNVADAPGTKERNDRLEKEGQQLASSGGVYGKVGLFRSRIQFLHTPAWMRGFDIAVATCQGSTAWGPGQAAIRDSIPTEQQYLGFNAGRDMTYSMGAITDDPMGTAIQKSHVVPSYIKSSTGVTTTMSTAQSIGRNISAQDRTTLENAAKQGAAMAQTTQTVAAVRQLIDNGNYKWGFDIGTSICKGSSMSGPGQDRFRMMLGPYSYNAGPDGDGERGSNEAMAGFTAAQALQFGITKGLNGPPAVAAGNLMVQGLTGGGFTPDQKAGVVTLAQNNAAVAAGANQAVKENTGFFHAILEFFGLG